MDFAVIVASLPTYAEAALATLRIAIVGIILAFVVGLVSAVIQIFRIPVLRQVVAAYIELSRNTPLLVQLFFLYFGLPKLGLTWSAETCAYVGLAFLGGSYVAEALRSGFEQIAPIQEQSALALGFSRTQSLRKVLLPQALSYALPALTANVIFLIKETSVFSILALPDLVYVAKEQIGNDYTTTEALTALVLFYLIILLPISLLAAVAEKKVRYATLGQ
ncbi:amino acid ABC transporter permease [Corynebacterium sp. UBA4397]|uniref:amino acid ABC transporter permease n=1 Tax=Corynebacterium sp. UBA4397 TaxID=1946394 RepID=UPI00257B7F8F|nr:amino acid ABC transporter permease [Corynebacterium sp. UBA4397]